MAVGGAHLTHCAHIYAGEGRWRDRERGGGAAEGLRRGRGDWGRDRGDWEGRGAGGDGGALAALVHHPQELTSYTYLTAEELVEEMVMAMEGPVEGRGGTGGTGRVGGTGGWWRWGVLTSHGARIHGGGGAAEGRWRGWRD